MGTIDDLVQSAKDTAKALSIVPIHETEAAAIHAANEAVEHIFILCAAITHQSERLEEAAKWLHAAYDRPPQTPEAKLMLERIDKALLSVHGTMSAADFDN